ncbi:MAG: nuclear transport factor 2 family protein [Pseudomonadota bacterium]|nr:nuclear transport factor 2 family protein [Pseudomonadota bacterium]
MESAGQPFHAVGALLGEYFDGLHHSDTTRLARVFHPSAHYVCVTSGELQQLDMPAYFAIVDQRPSPASRGESRVDRIVSIEFAGDVTASARVECAIGARHFDDLLTLIHVDGRWQIISKVFHYRVHPAQQGDLSAV